MTTQMVIIGVCMTAAFLGSLGGLLIALKG